MKKKLPADELSKEMEKFALAMAKDMAAGNAPAKEMIDGFKAVSTYYAQTRKLNLKTPDEDTDTESFIGFRNKINGVKDVPETN